MFETLLRRLAPVHGGKGDTAHARDGPSAKETLKKFLSVNRRFHKTHLMLYFCAANRGAQPGLPDSDILFYCFFAREGRVGFFKDPHGFHSGVEYQNPV